jgi:hypothetical protein
MALTYLSARHRDASVVEPEPCFSEIAVYIRSVVEFSLIAAGAIGGEEIPAVAPPPRSAPRCKRDLQIGGTRSLLRRIHSRRMTKSNSSDMCFPP